MPYARIATKQAKFALDQLHAELAGKLLDHKAEGERLRAAMIHVEAVLKLLDPTHNLRSIAIRRRTPNDWFRRGTILRTALGTLRKAEGPLTVAEVAERMVEAKGFQDAPRSAVAKLEGAIRAAFHKCGGVKAEGSPVRWSVTV